MKRKFLILTLCFTLVFSSINYRKSYADVGVISVPMLATISALAVGSNIIINNNDDLYDLGRMFYDYVHKHSALTWSTVQNVFSASIALQPNNLVSVDSEFLDIVKGFFDSKFSFPVYYNGEIPTIINPNDSSQYLDLSENLISNGITYLGISVVTSSGVHCPIYATYKNELFRICYEFEGSERSIIQSWVGAVPGTLGIGLNSTSPDGFSSFYVYCRGSYNTVNFGNVAFPYEFDYKGGYAWDNVEDKKKNESVSLPVPGNLGQLVGQGSTDFWENTDDLVGNGSISIPGVDSPSIDIDNSVSTFPGLDSAPGVDSPSVPNDGIFSNIKDFIVSLVVPSDTFWTDTWGGLYDNFTNSFPMVDMDGFNDLVTGEKKFPNIDIDIMGVTGRVVNGDIINSIVNWLRPIIAGFMMLCLMLFNYRKIYKLIRNSEPFGGIAPGTSDFKTGISEYTKEPVIKAVDMAAEYRAWKENGGK